MFVFLTQKGSFRSVFEIGDAMVLGTGYTAVNGATLLNTMSDDFAATVMANRSEGMDGTFK
jgi:hypothetical protein